MPPLSAICHLADVEPIALQCRLRPTTEHSALTIRWPVTGRSRQLNVRATVRANGASWPIARAYRSPENISMRSQVELKKVHRTRAVDPFRSFKPVRADARSGHPYRTIRGRLASSCPDRSDLLAVESRSAELAVRHQRVIRHRSHPLPARALV